MHIENLILGAGPAGMTAAVMAARRGVKVTLLDANPGVGRKLLVTGSGRANLTNAALDLSRYVCADPALLAMVMGRFGHAELIDFLHSLGILTFSTDDGWTYPRSQSARGVVDAFAAALQQAGIAVLLNTHIMAIRSSDAGFELSRAGAEPITCENLLVAAGGKAYPSLGSRGELFPSLQELGHSLHPLLPALAPVTAEMNAWHALEGVRVDAQATLLLNGSPALSTTGNLIFTPWGLNGPAVMDLSHAISAHAGDAMELRLNLIFDCEPELRSLLQTRRRQAYPLRVLLEAVLPPKVPPVILARCHLKADANLNELSDARIGQVFSLLKALPFKVTGVRGFEYCQVTAGGVPLSEVDPRSMASKVVPHLWLAGETLDVVGPCGGYNLQFAFSSGAVAGMSFGEAG
jgi:predicted Rossmann fold flavoprotein